MKPRTLLCLLLSVSAAACAHRAKPLGPAPVPLSFFTEGSDHCDYVPGFRAEQKARDEQMVGSKYALLLRGRAKGYARELDDDVCKLTVLKRELREGRAEGLCRQLGARPFSACFTAVAGQMHERRPLGALTIPLYLAMQMQFVMQERNESQEKQKASPQAVSDRALTSLVESLDFVGRSLRTRSRPPAADEELGELEREESQRLCKQVQRIGLNNVGRLLKHAEKAESARLRHLKKNFDELGDCAI